MDTIQVIKEELLSKNTEKITALTHKAVDEGLDPEKILYDGFVAGMEVVGAKFKDDELYIPEVIKIANNFKLCADILKPKLVGKIIKTSGKVIIGTVAGDMHDVGKNLVMLLLEASGFEVVDLGVDVPNKVFLEKVREHNPDVLGLSALLTTTMPNIPNIINALEEAGLKGKVKTIIGGAPVNQAFTDESRADAYGHDAIDAVEKIKALIAA